MNDWTFIEFVRSFLPRWLSAATSMKVVSISVLVLVVVVLGLRGLGLAT
jgi:hypothetical protein